MSEQPKIEGEGCYLEHCQAARDDGERYSARENGTRKDKKKKSYVEKAKVDSTAKCVCLSACAEHELSVRVPTRIVRITFGLRNDSRMLSSRPFLSKSLRTKARFQAPTEGSRGAMPPQLWAA